MLEENSSTEFEQMDLSLDWNALFEPTVISEDIEPVSIPDALVKSLTDVGKVDLEYISSITHEDYKTIIAVLKGSIYQNPETWDECYYKGWETAEEYLSGNLRCKWWVAQKANKKYNGRFAENLATIEKVLPPAVSSKDIYITLGSPWVPTDVIDDFIEYLLGDPFKNSPYYGTHRYEYATIHDEVTGTWEIPYKSRYNHKVKVCRTYGTDKVEALHILERTLNMKNIAVYDEVRSDLDPKKVRHVLNKDDTMAAVEKQQKMIKAFQDWVWTDPARKKLLEDIFDYKFASVRRRIFDGSFLTFPGLSEDVTLFPYQKDAVARILFTPNTLLAHDVGAGKTYVMIAAGQELRRMGLSEKNMYVVPNNLVGQWKEIFLNMYPCADIMTVEHQNFTPGKRYATLQKMRDEQHDAIIISYSCFERINLSKENEILRLEEEKAEIEAFLQKRQKSTYHLQQRLNKIRDTLYFLKSLGPDCSMDIYFDELGINRLFVDEAHNYKNVPLDTKTDHTLGINATGSKRCRDMMEKVHSVQRKNGGKGVVMATGTPITNSVSDVFVIQKYLQSGELALLDLQSFDAWIGMFAERQTNFEIDVDTNSYRLATRFSKFHNLPELTALLSSIADFHQVDESAGIPTHDGYEDTLINKSILFEEYLKDISDRADKVRKGRVLLSEDNMLTITTDGRKAALDIRLVLPKAEYTKCSKVAQCAAKVAEIYFNTADEKSTQLIFCDTSTPKAGFNLYDELKLRLIEEGVAEKDITFIHDAKTEIQREKLFAKVRGGEIRILLGSTFKLGLGVNIQDKLIALHHLDVPWRPADMTQREGRILRQGNTNKKVFIYRYIMEGSFDAYSWQLLETKQRFISELLAGSLSERSSADVEDTVLDYAEIKALAIGNQLLRTRVEKANEMARYMTLQRKLLDSRLQMEKELSELPIKIKRQENLIEKCKKDEAFMRDWRLNHPVATEDRKQIREILYTAIRDNVLKPSETKLMVYRGFSLILPANMTSDKPFIWLIREGKYCVELGDTDVGNLIRIDNFLDDLDGHLSKLSTGLSNYYIKMADLQVELAKDEGFADKIQACQKELDDMDKKLGVEKKHE